MKKPIALIILDGFGLSKKEKGNAIKIAKIPNIESYLNKYPNTTIKTSGLDVGLPDGQMGNSEVGHLNIGAGRVVYQELTRISKAIEDGEFFENECLLSAIENVKTNKSSLHFMGLLSDGGVHSHIDHLKGLLKLAKLQNVENVYVHTFLDGRDTAPNSGEKYLKEIEAYMSEIGIGKIASISGRYYAMDRDKRWERTKLAYDAMMLGKGEISISASDTILKSYENGKTDEFVLPTVIVEDGKPIGTIKENDSVIFFNFRPDRARQITRAIVDTDFSGFDREYVKTVFVSLTQYDITIKNKCVAFKPYKLLNTLGEYLSKNGIKQLRIAETEKYAHVTFFFNGGVEEANDGEERMLIPSPKVATYDLKPEMSAFEVKDKLLSILDEDKFDFIVLNFANSDMVGHTGIIDSAVKAVETVDVCTGEVVQKILSKSGYAIITADHGNAEEMIDENDEPITAHTTNEVPFILIGDESAKLRDDGRLCDIAPTILKIMNLEVPKEMTGKSIVL